MPLAICFRGHTCSPGRKTSRWHHWNLFAIEGKFNFLSHLQHISVYLIWLGGTSVSSALYNRRFGTWTLFQKFWGWSTFHIIPYTCLFHIDLIQSHTKPKLKLRCLTLCWADLVPTLEVAHHPHPAAIANRPTQSRQAWGNKPKKETKDCWHAWETPTQKYYIFKIHKHIKYIKI